MLQWKDWFRNQLRKECNHENLLKEVKEFGYWESKLDSQAIQAIRRLYNLIKDKRDKSKLQQWKWIYYEVF